MTPKPTVQTAPTPNAKRVGQSANPASVYVGIAITIAGRTTENPNPCACACETPKRSVNRGIVNVAKSAKKIANPFRRGDPGRWIARCAPRYVAVPDAIVPMRRTLRALRLV